MTDQFIKKVDDLISVKEKRVVEYLIMKLANPPKHVAVIMDGNGRWAGEGLDHESGDMLEVLLKFLR